MWTVSSPDSKSLSFHTSETSARQYAQALGGAAKIGKVIAADSRYARDNVKHSNFTARPGMQFGHDRPVGDKFDDKYGDEAGEVAGGPPRYSAGVSGQAGAPHEYRGGYNESNMRGVDMEPASLAERFAAAKDQGQFEGCTLEDILEWLANAEGGEVGEDDLPDGPHKSTSSPPVGTSGPVSYSDPRKIPYNQSAPYSARNNARSPEITGDDPPDLPTGLKPEVGGSMTPARHPAQDSNGYSSVKTPLMHALGAIHDARVAKMYHGNLAKTAAPPSYADTYRRHAGRAFSVGASDQAGQSMYAWEWSPPKTRKQLAQDRARTANSANRASFFARYPHTANIGGV